MSFVLREELITLNGQEIQAEAFPSLLERHLNTVGGTLALESQAARLRAAAFGNEQDVQQFVREVCRWGGYAGIGGRIVYQNPPRSICDAFQTACQYLDDCPAAICEAMRAVNALKQLQRISFASKHLRFLRPDLCPVLDSLLSAWLAYPLNGDGYVRFATDCQEIARALDARDIPLPNPLKGRKWRAADVEMALFARRQGWEESYA